MATLEEPVPLAASVAPQEDTQMFDVEMWRHAFSCANLKQLKGDFVDQHGYTDPNLSLWGILTALKQSTSDAYKSYYAHQEGNKTFVHVSVLFRTWATAICLYLPHIQETGTLTLIVSPFLRENESGSDNLPTTFDAQIVKLKSFYGLLHQCFKNLGITFPTHTIRLFDGRQTEKLVSYNVSVESGVVTFTVPGTPLAQSVDTPQPEINSTYLERQTTIIGDSPHGLENITSSDNTMTNAPTIKYDSIEPKHYLESDCKKFLFWMSSCKTQIKKIVEGEVFLHLPNDYVEYIKSQSLPRLRVVCHSKILQALCKTLFDENSINKLYTTKSGLLYGTKKKKLIANNNMWGLKFNLYNTPAGSDVYSLKSQQITLFHGSAKPTTGDVASACEIGCDFGQNRGNDCENSMKGESKSGFFTGLVSRTSKFSLPPSRDQAIAAGGGKRKTRRIYKQKITRKRKAKKSRKSVRRVSRR